MGPFDQSELIYTRTEYGIPYQHSVLRCADCSQQHIHQRKYMAQLTLCDFIPTNPRPIFARAGSQRWLQIATEQAPDLLFKELQPALGLEPDGTIKWISPRPGNDYREYRDMRALWQLGIENLPVRSLTSFWPPGGPAWDALGVTSEGQYLFVEAKAHCAEMFSPPTRAKHYSRMFIQKSLLEARQYYAPNTNADWSQTFYQYANRLAHQYLFRVVNGLPTCMIFLHFINAYDVNGPTHIDTWLRPLSYLHRRLGIQRDLELDYVYHSFFDVASLE